MPDSPYDSDKLLAALQERAKELHCLYQVEEVLSSADLQLHDALEMVVRAIPPGWQYPQICQARITYLGRTYSSAEFAPTEWILRADLMVQNEIAGMLEVFYTESTPDEDEGPFLKEEARLVRSIADRLSQFLLYQRLKSVSQDFRQVSAQIEEHRSDEWRLALSLLRRTDKHLYIRIARKMLNHLYWSGIDEAGDLLRRGTSHSCEAAVAIGEINESTASPTRDETWLLTDQPFAIASRHLNTEEILSRVQRWMLEDRASHFTKIMHNERSSLPEVVDALRRYHHVVEDENDLPRHSIDSLRVALIRRLLTEQLDFIMVAKERLGTHDFGRILDRAVLPAGSNGKLGGKAAGLILAYRSLLDSDLNGPAQPVALPLSWFVASSAMQEFIAHNDLEDVLEQKYKTIEEVRHDYPYIVNLFKSSPFPPDLVTDLSVALDAFETRPLIVRSSSLLEDRFGAAFSGKYKSLFLANQGSKSERMDALLRAIAEVYASVFGPDPIEYRREHSLLHFREEMGILIQEVVGRRVGKYFFPAFSGVAFSNNEFRWSPRIKREDGLVRLVTGLGTRAVDRVADDYPILIVPGQSSLRVNASTDEISRYSPKRIDLIDLEQRSFRTVEISDLIKECGADYPAFGDIFSVREGDILRRATPLLFDPEKDDMVVTFEGLLSSSPFVPLMQSILSALHEALGKPVDIEFAHDGKTLFLLQCRTQSPGDNSAPAPIPREVHKKDVLFSANRYVSNGWLPDLTHLVYVDPSEYANLDSRADKLAIGRIVGRLNIILPKRRFALLGPGRWGSRGDINLGVSVTYADINNTALLVEIARQKGSYVPDLSFGTHFFQDLVESQIRYLPLYPDEDGVAFAQRFFLHSPNLLPALLPDYARFEGVVKVIDIPGTREGKVLRVLMNADLDEALGLLVQPDDTRARPRDDVKAAYHLEPGEAWRWRLQMVENLAAGVDPDRFGVVGLYVFGSTKNATAGPASDIDLLIHIRSTEAQQTELDLWLEGWDLALVHMNYLRTGYHCTGLLDVHYVTDEDIKARTSWAVKIGAVTDAARPLPMKR